jgi:hypothetical protein
MSFLGIQKWKIVCSDKTRNLGWVQDRILSLKGFGNIKLILEERLGYVFFGNTEMENCLQC